VRRLVRFLVPSVLALVLASWALPAGATHNADQHDKMDLLFTSPNSRINSRISGSTPGTWAAPRLTT